MPGLPMELENTDPGGCCNRMFLNFWVLPAHFMLLERRGTPQAEESPWKTSEVFVENNINYMLLMTYFHQEVKNVVLQAFCSLFCKFFEQQEADGVLLSPGAFLRFSNFMFVTSIPALHWKLWVPISASQEDDNEAWCTVIYSSWHYLGRLCSLGPLNSFCLPSKLFRYHRCFCLRGTSI